jgi:glycosyltransferase involved in cell wall biosynthesis
MKISIVTISLNQGEFLEQAIRSVIDQDHEDLEYILVDAGSNDNSRKIIERYTKRIDKVIFEPDEGPADGLNKGFQYATGEVCGYLNADDLYIPGVFTKVAKIFADDPQLDMVCGAGFIIDETNNKIYPIYSDSFNLRRYTYGAVSVVQQSTFFKRQALLEVGGFNKGNLTCWDGELILDMALRGKRFKAVKEYWSCFRLHQSSISGSGARNDIYFQDLDRFFQRVYGRRKTRGDHLLAQVFRLEKFFLNPITIRTFLGRLRYRRKVTP